MLEDVPGAGSPTKSPAAQLRLLCGPRQSSRAIGGFHCGQLLNEVDGFVDGVGSGFTAAGVGGDAVHVEFGAVHPAAPDDEFVHAGVADHDTGDLAGCVRAFAK